MEIMGNFANKKTSKISANKCAKSSVFKKTKIYFFGHPVLLVFHSLDEIQFP
jgi:hypothetical protein